MCDKNNNLFTDESGNNLDLKSKFEALLADIKQDKDFFKPTAFQKFKGALNAMKDAVKQKFESSNEQTPQSPGLR